MMEDTIDINEIIIRYLDGSATLEEKVRLLQWLKQSDGNRSDFVDTRDLWLSCNVAAGNELEVDIALEQLRNRILLEQERIQKAPDAQKKKIAFNLVRWTQIAAAVLLLLGIGYGAGNWSGSLFQKPIIMQQLITAKGSKGQFTLPDGSVVWLNSESRLSFPENFAGKKRLVILDGEGYFEVKKDVKKPFVVQVGELDVEVLGTCFNVDNYASNEVVQTALLNGSVKISGKAVKEPVYLEPNELFQYQKSNHTSIVEKAKANLYADWIKDRMVFDNTVLSDILISMEGRYNLDIECPVQFAADTRMSFTIRQETIEEVLEAMSYIVPIRYELKNGKAYIIPK